MKYFIIIDMQNDFCTGALKNDATTAIIPAIAEKAKELKAQGWKIIATRDTHSPDYMNTQEGKNLPVAHCIEGTKGWEVVDEIKPIIDDYVNKNSFGYDNWLDYFDYDEPDEIAMCGTCTSICVASNFSILKANFPEVPITVYKDLCACLNKDTHEAAITVMKCQQAIIK